MLRDAILSTLAYYDVLDMPLTAEEVFRFLIKKDAVVPSLQDVHRELEHKKQIGEREGFYYLFDREYLVPLRKEHERLAQRKWRIARRAGWWMRMVPFVRVVFASGSLSMNNTDELSDLDIIVVAKHGYIWMTRFLLHGLLMLLGKGRRHKDRVAPDKICPNHFITDASLGIPFHNMYTAQLYVHLVPLIAVDYDDLKKFRMANAWVLDYTSRWDMPEDKIVRQGLSFAIQLAGEMVLSIFGTIIERMAARYQKLRIERNATPLKPGGHLTYSDEALAFHAQSSSAEILAKYDKNLLFLSTRGMV